MFAGSDTTAITPHAIVYYALKTPHVHRKLEQELDEANLPMPISYKTAQASRI